ncbi:MAG: chromosome partitioning protein ParB, partial [Bacteroidetes bacterium]
PKIKDFKQDYSDAQSDHDAHTNDVKSWLDNLNIEGAAKIEKKKGRSSIVPKLIRKQAEWRYSSLSEPFLSTPDLFNTDPVSYEDTGAAIQNGLVLNNQFNTKLQKVKFIDDFIHTAVDEGTVIVRVGWDFEEEEQEIEVPDFNFVPSLNPEVANELQQLAQLAQQDPEKFKTEVPPHMQQAVQLSIQSGQPVEAIPAGFHTEMQMVTVKNQPTIEVCNYDNVTIDPTCMGDIEKAEFAIYSFETSLSELEKDGKYSNLDKINIEANSIIGSSDHNIDDDSSFNFTDKPRKKFIAHEYWGYWDIHGDGIARPIVGTYVGDVMIRLEENPFPDGKLPFVTAQYLPIRRQIYGEPDGVLLEDNQKIIGAVTRGMIDIMGRSANGQTGTRKDALDITNKRKYDRGLDYEFNAQVDPRNAFHMHTYAEIPQSAGLMLELQNADAESLTGVKAFHSGISGQSISGTATGVRSAMDATSKRELNILRRLAEGIKQVGRKIVAMNSVFLSEEEVIRITNEEFVTVRRDDLAGNFDIRLSISTAEADNEKAQELAFMLQTTAQSMGSEFSQIILADIARLRKMPELAKRITDFQPQPDPLAERIKELEVEKLEKEIAKLDSEAKENMTDAMLNQAKVGTEQAKANDLQSTADKKDLDYVETESGTTQERDLQKVSQQAKANTKMKVVEGIMKERLEDKKIENTPSSGQSEL